MLADIVPSAYLSTMTTLESTGHGRELGARLRWWRERAGFNGTEMAARLCWTASTLSRVESGKRPVSQLEVAKYTAICGVYGQEQDELIALAAEPIDYRVKTHGGRIPDEFQPLMFHESAATKIESFQPIYIPGITQTEDYARAVFTEGRVISPDKIEEYVRIRKARADVLTRFSPAMCTFWVHENALRAQVGGPKVMAEQLLYLLFLDSRPQCSIRVVPVSAGVLGMAAGSFQIFSYRDGKPLVCIQHVNTSEFLESKEELAEHRSVLRQLASVALDESRSRDFIVSVVSDFERQGAARHEGAELA